MLHSGQHGLVLTFLRRVAAFCNWGIKKFDENGWGEMAGNKQCASRDVTKNRQLQRMQTYKRCLNVLAA